MARKIEVPKINTVTVQYNGNSKEFDRFMESMIREYLHSGSIAPIEQRDVVDKVEKTRNRRKRWTCRRLCGIVCGNAGTTQRTCQRRMIK